MHCDFDGPLSIAVLVVVLAVVVLVVVVRLLQIEFRYVARIALVESFAGARQRHRELGDVLDRVVELVVVVC